jgi:hypothetical protein
LSCLRKTTRAKYCRSALQKHDLASESDPKTMPHPKYWMQRSFCLYPITTAEALEVAEQIKLPFHQTHIEPSRFQGYLLEDLSSATFLMCRFDAKRWPTKNDDLFLMYVERSRDVAAWMGSCGCEFRIVDIAAVLFRSDEDQKSFEKVLWPHR